MNDRQGKHKIVLERIHWALYIELVSKIAIKFNTLTDNIQSLIFEGTDVTIENDMDILQLQNGDVVEVTFYSL